MRDEFLEEFAQDIYDWHNDTADELASKAYREVLLHLLEHVLDARQTGRDMLYTLERELKEVGGERATE